MAALLMRAVVAAAVSCVLLPAIVVEAEAKSKRRPKSGRPAPQAPTHTLREVAPRGFRVGAAINHDVLRRDSDYGRVAGQQYNLLVAENEMKWFRLRPVLDRYEFGPADALVDFAREHDMEVHGHALVWGKQLPTWLLEGLWTRESLVNVMRDHIHSVVGHYRGRVKSWDVVNESLAQNIWYRVIGFPEYVELAFRFAHEADPDAVLFYNEINADRLNDRADDVLRIVRYLRARMPDVPLGVGLEMHTSVCPPYGAYCPPTRTELERNLRRLADEGVEVAISEMDVRLNLNRASGKNLNTALSKQADVYRSAMQACLNVSRCNRFTTWGFTDRSSWIPRAYDGYGLPLPLDRNLKAKPAFNALCATLRGSSC